MSDDERRANRSATAFADIERLFVPGERRYTQAEVVERAGVPQEEARRYWRAMGFADVPDDEPVFTDTDIEALVTLRRLIEEGVIDAGVALQLTRVYGQSLARMADAQVAAVRERIEAPLREADASALEVLKTATSDRTPMNRIAVTRGM